MDKCPLHTSSSMTIPDDHPQLARELPNGDKVCWYCGSWDREQFVAYCKRILEGDIFPTYDVTLPGTVPRTMNMPRLELNDRKLKIYIHQDGIANAAEGAIKVYVAHLTQEDLEVVTAVKRITFPGWEDQRTKH